MMGSEMNRDPLDQSDLSTLEAELREAVQHRDAAVQRAAEAGKELEGAIERARVTLARVRKACEGESERMI